MKIRLKEKVPTAHLEKGDTIQLEYRQEIDGKEVFRETVCKDTIDRPIKVDTAIIFDVEEGDFGEEVEDGIGGAFLQTKEAK